MKRIFFLLPILFCLGCQESEEISIRNYPFIQTLQLSNLDENGVTIEAQILKNGTASIESYGVEYLESQYVENIYSEVDFITKEILESPDSELFSIRIESDLIAGEEYHTKPFVRSNGYKVYGEALIFQAEGSRAPEITEVNSSVLGMRLQVVIKGKNFSTRIENNLIEVPGAEEYFRFNIVEATSETLRVQAMKWNSLAEFSPDQRFDLQVTTLGRKTVLPNHFSIAYPRITSLNTLKAKAGEEILVNLALEEEMEFMYLTINYDQNISLFLRLEKVSGDLYRTVMKDFAPGKYQLGLLMEGNYTTYSEQFEVTL